MEDGGFIRDRMGCPIEGRNLGFVKDILEHIESIRDTSEADIYTALRRESVPDALLDLPDGYDPE